MIDKHADPEAWAMLAYELEDAAEALATLLDRFEADGFGEPEFEVNLAHVYSHLNRAWNSRNATSTDSLDPGEARFREWSQFPNDLDLMVS